MKFEIDSVFSDKFNHCGVDGLLSISSLLMLLYEVMGGQAAGIIQFCHYFNATTSRLSTSDRLVFGF